MLLFVQASIGEENNGLRDKKKFCRLRDITEKEFFEDIRCATKNFSLLRTYAKSPLVSAKTRIATGRDFNFVIKVNNSVWIKSLIDQEVTNNTNSNRDLQKVKTQ